MGGSGPPLSGSRRISPFTLHEVSMAAAPYQDVLKPDGGLAVSGYRECADRYSVIATQLPKLPDAPTVLDFGANAGYFSLRLAREHRATCTAIDSVRALDAVHHPRVRVIRRHHRAREIGRLPRHDLVLCLSVLHHNTDWRALLTALRGRARHMLIVETPHPDEVLRVAPARDELAEIDAAVSAWGTRIGEAPGVRSDHARGLYAIPTGPIRATVFPGGGNCGVFWKPLVDQLATVLKYRPFPGSLNVRLPFPGIAPVRNLFGPPKLSFWDKRRPKGGKRGGDYQFWPVRFGHGDHSISGHVMVPGVRGHGLDGLELVAPIPLRETWGLSDGDALWIQHR